MEAAGQNSGALALEAPDFVAQLDQLREMHFKALQHVRCELQSQIDILHASNEELRALNARLGTRSGSLRVSLKLPSSAPAPDLAGAEPSAFERLGSEQPASERPGSELSVAHEVEGLRSVSQLEGLHDMPHTDQCLLKQHEPTRTDVPTLLTSRCDEVQEVSQAAVSEDTGMAKVSEKSSSLSDPPSPIQMPALGSKAALERKSLRSSLKSQRHSVASAGGARNSTLSMKSYDSACSIAEQEVVLLQMWERQSVSSKPRRRLSRMDGADHDARLEIGHHGGVSTCLCERLLHRAVVTPESKPRLVWEVFGMGFACMDVLVIPFDAGFAGSLPEVVTLVTEAMSLGSTLFWSVDIPLSFFCGYHHKGVIETRPRQVAWRYLTTWLPMDLCITSADWMVLGFEAVASSTDGVDMIRLGRALRLVRFLRLLRVLKVRGILCARMVGSERHMILGGLFRTLVFVLMLNHLVACLWFSSAGWGDGETWLRRNGMLERGIAYKYLSSLHWSLTQFTPASMEIVPVNALERFVAVVVIFGGMVIFSSFISIITNALTSLRNLDSHKMEQTSKLRRFLQERGLSQSLTVRIWSCLPDAMSTSQNRLQEKDIPVLDILPSSVRLSISRELYMPVLATHPFFAMLQAKHGDEADKLCRKATEARALSAGHELFNAWDRAERMFFIVKGWLLYTQELEVLESAWTSSREGPWDTDSMSGEAGTSTSLMAGAWCCEQVLWVTWMHTGHLGAVGLGEVLVLDGHQARELLHHLPRARTYARRFAEFHSQCPALLDDVWMDVDVARDLVGSSGSRLRCSIASMSSVASSTGSAYGSENGDSSGNL